MVYKTYNRNIFASYLKFEIVTNYCVSTDKTGIQKPFCIINAFLERDYQFSSISI